MHELLWEYEGFGELENGGWKKGKVFLINLLSGLTFSLGGIIVYLALTVNTDYRITFNTGIFLYFEPSDLILQINKNNNHLRHITSPGSKQNLSARNVIMADLTAASFLLKGMIVFLNGLRQEISLE